MKIIACVLLLLLINIPSGNAKKEWEEMKGGNFIIYYRNVPLDFVNTVMEEAEEQFRTVTENLGISRYQSWSWEKRARIYIFANEEDYTKNAGQAVWSHGAAEVRSKKIMTYPSASGFFDALLPHELGHIILHEYVGHMIPIPVWFDEGVAMYQEKAKRLGAHDAVRKAIEKGEFIPLTDLANMPLYKNTEIEKVHLFYNESASVVNFMITQLGDQNFYRLCRELKNQRRFDDALSAVYPRIRDIQDLNKMWRQYLEAE